MNNETDLMLKPEVIKPQDIIPHEILSKVVLTGDLSNLQDTEIMIYVNAFCQSLGLNPLTKPFDIIEDKKSGKKTLYARKDCTEQLRKIHRVSVVDLKKDMINDKTYIVTAKVRTPDGREDISTGAVSMAGCVGDVFCNMLMKAETKAKRRATLSICGLGILDESELDTFNSGFYKTNEQQEVKSLPPSKSLLHEIEKSSTLEELRDAFEKSYKSAIGNKNLQSEILKAKDKRKSEIEQLELNKLVDELSEEFEEDISDEFLKA